MVKSIGYSILPMATQDTVRFTSCGHEKHGTLFVQNRETNIHPPPPPRAALIMVCPQRWLITTLVSEQYRLPTIGRPRALAYSHTVYLPIIIGMNGRGGGVMLTLSARPITHVSTVKITNDHFITTWPGYTSSFEFIEHQRQNCMNDSSRLVSLSQ